jgi:CBS domain-containing protein
LGVRHLPVTAGDDQLVGMVSMRDLLAVETWT